MSKKSFILYTDACDIFNDLDDVGAGKLIKALVFYQTNQETDHNLDATTRLLSKSFIQQFRRDEEKYVKVVERNKKNIEKRWAKPKTEDINLDTSGISGNENHTKSYQGLPNCTKNTDNDNETVTVTENDFNKKIHSSSFYVDQKEEDFIKNDCEGVIQDFKIDLDVDSKKPDKTPPDSLFDLELPREPKKRKRASKGDPRKKQHYIPDDFELTDDLANFAFENADRFEINWDINMIRLEFDKFKSHYKNADGYVARKLDWSEAFKSWILKAIGYKVDAKNNKPVFYINPTPGKQDQTPGKQGNTLEVLNQATKDNPWELLNQATSDKDKWALLNQAVAGRRI
jgi:hypothetical protein